MSTGWIKLHRALLCSPDWQEKPCTRGKAWVDLLLRATYTDAPRVVKFRGNSVEILVPRGHLAATEVELAESWGWSRMKVRRFLGVLETRQQIRQQKNNVTSLIEIVNWDEYQGGDTADETPEKHQKNTRKTSGYIGICMKEGEEGKEEKENPLKGVKEKDSPSAPRKAPSRATSWPDGFMFNEDHIRLGREHGFTEAQVAAMFRQFKAYCDANGKRYLKWNAAFSYWIGNQKGPKTQGDPFFDTLREIKDEEKRKGEMLL